MKVLVTGASGFIGSRLCTRLREAGHEAVAMMRPRRDAGPYPDGEAAFGHLPYGIPERAWQGVDSVIHCAGATTGQDEVESRSVNVESTRVLINVARKLPDFRRFVFVSSQSAHEGAISAYGKTKSEAEQLVRASGLPYAILRPGLVFGPGPTGLFARMRGTVKRLPVLPLLGGGKAIVQPICVDDLCEAMVRCLLLDEGESPELNLGEPAGMSLREFLQAIAVAETGNRKPELVIPLGPIKAVVAIGEKLGLPLPVSSDNLKGMEVVRTMETAPSLNRLKLKLQAFDAAMQAAVGKMQVAPTGKQPLRVLLIGAGKIGIVHALNLTQREGVALCGVSDRNPKAFNLYRNMGFRCPFIPDALEALERLKPDGAVIATPASTHLSIARMCVERGVHVLVEKPLAITPGMLDEFEELARTSPEIACHVGYMAAQYPHLDRAKEILDSGEFGAVRGVWGFCLQSHIMAPKPVRWEMIKAQSGGGVLINFASHVLSIMLRLLGSPAGATAAMWPVHSVEVEDAAEVVMDYRTFTARIVASWSIPGYARPENRIVIEFEGATVVIENFCMSVKRNGRTAEIRTQRDFETGYNAAPDYTGGGFSMEHRNFREAIDAAAAGRELRRTLPGSISAAPVGFAEAAGVERFIFDLYGTARGKEGIAARLRGAKPPGPSIGPDEEMDAVLGGLL